MRYKCTSESPTSLLYLGIRFFIDDEGKAQCAMHDRAVGYPIDIDRYPEGGTVANPAQLGGVIMGRLVAAQRTCSTMALFKDVVAGIFTHCVRRHYTRRLVHSVWTKFLVRYWDHATVTGKELRAWFHPTWTYICNASHESTPPTQEERKKKRGKTEKQRPPASASSGYREGAPLREHGEEGAQPRGPLQPSETHMEGGGAGVSTSSSSSSSCTTPWGNGGPVRVRVAPLWGLPQTGSPAFNARGRAPPSFPPPP
jgi:hypothetical protein